MPLSKLMEVLKWKITINYLRSKKDFSLWRSKRKRGTPVPRELKERTCSLLEEEGVYRVAKACTVSKNLLDTWNKNLSEAPAEKKTEYFIELRKPLLANNDFKSKKLSIELTLANGDLREALPWLF